MKRCCGGSSYVQPSSGDVHLVRCTDCDAVLAMVEGPRDEVYADL